MSTILMSQIAEIKQETKGSILLLMEHLARGKTMFSVEFSPQRGYQL